MNTKAKYPTTNYARTFQDPRDLEAPFVPAAFHDADDEGLLPVSALVQPIKVELKVWDVANPGDRYQLMWNDKLAGESKTIGSERPGDDLFLVIPAELLVEGVHALGYHTLNSENGTVDFSLLVRIEVDLTPPGRPQLGPIKLPPEVEGGLTSAELTELGDHLEIEVGSYTGMRKHDVVRTFWGTVEGPGAVVTKDDMGLKRVHVIYSRAFLESLGDFNGIVSYTVTDRAGNESAQSLGAIVQLMLKDVPSNFPAPVIDPALGSLIDYAEAKAGVNVDIPHYPDAAALDLITLHWGEDNSSLPLVLPAGNEDKAVVLSITVPYETIAVLPEGRPNITYSVQRDGQPVGRSMANAIEVFLTLPVAEQLDAAIIQGTSITNPNADDNFIDEDDYELNGRAIIAWKDDLQVSDDLNLYWGQEFIPQWYQIKDSDVSAQRDLTITIPNSMMKKQGTGATISVRYSVTRFGNPNPANALSQNVVVRSRSETPGGTSGLDGPTFITNDNGVVGPIENPDGAPVKIAPYLNIQRNQIVQLTFIAFDNENNPVEAANFSGERELDANDIVTGYTFIVPATHLKMICRGWGEAHFKVIPAPESNQSPATSRTTRVRINMSRPASGCHW